MLSYTIDYSDTAMFLSKLALESEAATRLFFASAAGRLKELLIETVMEVTQDGFPPIYKDHLIEVINATPPIVLTSAGVDVDLMLLGSYEDYTKGFHRHAIDTEKQRIELPYAGQGLKNDVTTRATYWEDEVAPTFLYDDTLYNRIEVWGALAPEWWVLQNGSEYEPNVDPQPLAELIAAKAAYELPALYEEMLQEAVNLADQGLGVRPGGGTYHNIRGGFAQNTGQFSPRG